MRIRALRAVRRSPLLLFAGLLLLAGCTGLRVHSDYDQSFDFRGLTTYAWLEPPVVDVQSGGEAASEPPDPFARNSLLDKRVRHAVDRMLAARGYRISDENPDLRLQYHVVLRDRTRIRSDPGFYYGGRYGYYGGVGGSTSRDYQEGTLILDFIDPESGRIAWRGWAVGANREGYYSEERVDESVDKILAEFPPDRAQ